MGSSSGGSGSLGSILGGSGEGGGMGGMMGGMGGMMGGGKKNTPPPAPPPDKVSMSSTPRSMPDYLMPEWLRSGQPDSMGLGAYSQDLSGYGQPTGLNSMAGLLGRAPQLEGRSGERQRSVADAASSSSVSMEDFAQILNQLLGSMNSSGRYR